jgi:hypothetical protein
MKLEAMDRFRGRRMAKFGRSPAISIEFSLVACCIDGQPASWCTTSWYNHILAIPDAYLCMYFRFWVIVIDGNYDWKDSGEIRRR